MLDHASRCAPDDCPPVSERVRGHVSDSDRAERGGRPVQPLGCASANYVQLWGCTSNVTPDLAHELGPELEGGHRNEDTPDRVTAAVGGCAPATSREGEGLYPRP